MIRFSGTLREDHVWRRIFAPSTSPAGLAGWGILLAVAYGVVHALGWREHTGFLSLTASPGLTLGETAPRGTVCCRPQSWSEWTLYHRARLFAAGGRGWSVIAKPRSSDVVHIRAG